MKTSIVVTSRLNKFSAIALCVDSRPVAVAFGAAKLLYRGEPRRRYELCIPREGLHHKDYGVVFWAEEIDARLWLQHFPAVGERNEALK